MASLLYARERDLFDLDEVITLDDLTNTDFEGIGRLQQKYPRAAQYDEITVDQDDAGPNAKAIPWQRITPVDDTLPGVYRPRTNQTEWDERTLWHTSVTLTDLEAVFRSLKSELGLGPV